MRQRCWTKWRCDFTSIFSVLLAVATSIEHVSKGHESTASRDAVRHPARQASSEGSPASLSHSSGSSHSSTPPSAVSSSGAPGSSSHASQAHQHSQSTASKSSPSLATPSPPPPPPPHPSLPSPPPPPPTNAPTPAPTQPPTQAPTQPPTPAPTQPPPFPFPSSNADTVSQAKILNLPIPKLPENDFKYERSDGHICSGRAYTDDANNGCNGWQHLSEVECQQKCTDGATANNCPTKKCYAAAFFAGSGWCHLFEPKECRSLMDQSHVSIYRKKSKAKNLLEQMGIPTSKVKKELKTPVAKEVMGGAAALAAAGVAAAGIAGALATRQEETTAIPHPTAVPPPIKQPLSPTQQPVPTAPAMLQPHIGIKPSMPLRPSSPPAAKTILTQAIPRGATVLQIASPVGFQVGRTILIDEGTGQQEMNVISRFGSMVLQHPLAFNHPGGASITMRGTAALPEAAVPMYTTPSPLLRAQSPTAMGPAEAPTTFVATVAPEHSSASLASMPLWLPLVVTVCCFISLLMTACIFASRKKDRGRGRQHSRSQRNYREYDDGSSEDELDYEDDPHRDHYRE